MIRHFLTLKHQSPEALRLILTKAHSWKQNPEPSKELAKGKTLIMFFAKPSTRTRLSFEIAFKQLGGDVATIEGDQSQVSRGETIQDTIRVFNGYGDIVMWRTKDHQELAVAQAAATIPIINGLTALEHPCQVLADLMTLQEHKQGFEGKRVLWFGDYSNVARSWVAAANLLGFSLGIVTPQDLSGEELGQNVSVHSAFDSQMLKKADCITTDTWFSMDAQTTDNSGDKAGNKSDNKASIKAQMLPYQVNEKVLAAAPDAIFLHCLPATRGEEVTEGVLEHPQSKVWDESANRLHIQKAILAWCLNKI